MDFTYCILELGAANQRIIRPDGTSFSCPVDEVPEAIAFICNDYENYKVQLGGPKEYAKKIAMDIKETETKTYARNMIHVEVI